MKMQSNDTNTIIVDNTGVDFNGVHYPYPKGVKGHNVSIDCGTVVVDGYTFKNGAWSKQGVAKSLCFAVLKSLATSAIIVFGIVVWIFLGAILVQYMG